MNRVERILIKPADANYRAVAHICRLSKTVYNCASYLMRQSFFDHELISWATADKRLKAGKQNHPAYGLIPNAMSQSIIKRLGADWKSFFAALADYKTFPGKYKARPKLPGYSMKAKTASMPLQHLKCVDGHIHFPIKTGLSPVKVICCDNQPLKAKGAEQIISEIRFVPHGSCYWLEVVYRQSAASAAAKQSVLLDKEKFISIDLGVNNLATLISNQPGYRPVLINGRVVKSVNHLYNKDVAVLRKKGHSTLINHKAVRRACWMNDHLHKVSHFIVHQAVANDVGNLVIGSSPSWKQSINIGKVNNQKFVSIPHARLIDMIRYKANAYGIEVVVREESYTSKASAMDLDPVPTYDPTSAVKHVFSGRRVKRGLYKTSTNLLVNADVNGALNILRKEIGDGFMAGIDEGLVFRPRQITLG
jgi:putative transposase